MTFSTRVDLSDRQELALTVAMQAALVAILLFGAVGGNPRVALNAAGALVVSVLPAILRRESRLRIDVVLLLWLTVAALLHAIGVLGPYRNVFWWDYLTHAVSASIFVGVAYAVVLAQERSHEADSLPEPFRSVYMFLLVVAMGVLWEVLEFALTEVSKVTGGKSALIVFGVQDVVTDLLFSIVGGVLVLLWGRRYFHDLSRALARRFAD